MENYDNLFEQQPEQTEQPFDREAWARQKREQRQELYNLIEEMSEKALTDPSALSDYLNMQARLGKTSVANTMLMIAQKPNATFISGFDDWQRRGRSVKRGEKAALVLEANGEYERSDGTMGVNFDVKRVFDISQTYGKPVRERSRPTIRTALKAITTNTPIPIKLTDGVPYTAAAVYSEKDKTIYVAKGVEGNNLFFALSRELARAQGFPAWYVLEQTADGTPITKTAQVRGIGNSVCPPIAAALAAANYSPQEYPVPEFDMPLLAIYEN